jgi:hypothetical protein
VIAQLSTQAPLELQIGHSCCDVQSALLEHRTQVLVAGSQRGRVCAHWLPLAHSTHSPFAGLQTWPVVDVAQSAFWVQRTHTPRASQCGVAVGQATPFRHVSMQ